MILNNTLTFYARKLNPFNDRSLENNRVATGSEIQTRKLKEVMQLEESIKYHQHEKKEAQLCVNQICAAQWIIDYVCKYEMATPKEA